MYHQNLGYHHPVSLVILINMNEFEDSLILFVNNYLSAINIYVLIMLIGLTPFL